MTTLLLTALILFGNIVKVGVDDMARIDADTKSEMEEMP